MIGGVVGWLVGRLIRLGGWSVGRLVGCQFAETTGRETLHFISVITEVNCDVNFVVNYEGTDVQKSKRPDDKRPTYKLQLWAD